MTDIRNYIILQIKRFISNNKISSVCDYGCGDGGLLKYLKLVLFKKIDFYGIDIFEYQDTAFLNSLGIRTIEKRTLTKQACKKISFDLIVSIRSMHHFVSPNNDFTLMAEMTTDKSIIWIFDYASINVFSSKRVASSDIEYSNDKMHRYYSLDSALSILESSGLVILDSRSDIVDVDGNELEVFGILCCK